jgi:hypothetical protein
MKKSLLTVSLAVAFAFGFSSCKKCVTCSDCADGVELTDANGNTGTELEYCEDDFTSEEEYDASIALLESFGGCKCN